MRQAGLAVESTVDPDATYEFSEPIRLMRLALHTGCVLLGEFNRSGRGVTPTTTRSLKRSTGSTRRSSSASRGRGGRRTSSSSPRRSGSAGGTRSGCTAASATSRRPSTRPTTIATFRRHRLPDANRQSLRETRGGSSIRTGVFLERPNTVHWRHVTPGYDPAFGGTRQRRCALIAIGADRSPLRGLSRPS